MRRNIDPPADLPSHVRALLDAGAYPHPVDHVELVQTHISYVLLAGAFAYKLKKAVDFGFVDYTTIERRRAMCEAEVRLNRRLCDGVYLGVSTVRRDGDRTTIDATGAIVDYAVRMRRVPGDRMMDRMLMDGRVTAGDVRALAARIAAFHRDAATSDAIAAIGSPESVGRNWRENFDEWRDAVGLMATEEQARAIREYGDTFLATQAGLLDRRMREGRVRDCHGDLRSDAVVFGDGNDVCVMDCVEFNERLRHGDIASDFAFMMMDLEFRGVRPLADAFTGAYLERMPEDETVPLVLDFYRCYRAQVRGKVESLLAADQGVSAAVRAAAADRARRYFALATRYATTERRPRLIYMVGLSGSGKSYVACALAGRMGAALVRSDAVRREIYGEHAPDAYADEARERVYGVMIERARSYLAEGRAVVLDATHLTRARRERVRSLGREADVTVTAVEVTAEEEIVRERLDAREGGADRLSDARWVTYVAQREEFEVTSEVPGGEIVRVDSTAPLSESLDAIEAAVG